MFDRSSKITIVYCGIRNVYFIKKYEVWALFVEVENIVYADTNIKHQQNLAQHIYYSKIKIFMLYFVKQKTNNVLMRTELYIIK